MSGFTHPDKLLLRSTISFNEAPISPMLGGKAPERRLLASTSTEARDSPRFPGMGPENRLLLRKSASRLSFSNARAGISPSNSLNRRSK